MVIRTYSIMQSTGIKAWPKDFKKDWNYYTNICISFRTMQRTTIALRSKRTSKNKESASSFYQVCKSNYLIICDTRQIIVYGKYWLNF